MPKYYAVKRGRTTGIYRSWAECKQQVDKFSGARYKSFAKSFASSCEASQFLQGQDNVPAISHKITGLRHTARYMSSNCPYAMTTPSYSIPNRSTPSCSIPNRSIPNHSIPNRSTPNCSIPVVYSDGCCFGNGRTNAKAGIGVFWGSDNSYNVSEKLIGPQTNQRAELTAAYRAIEGAISQGFSSIEVRTDSRYTIKAVTEWMPKWQRNGWRTVSGTDVKNKADMEKLSNVCSKIDVKWTHVPGHHGIMGNECADELAKLGSSK